MFKLFEDYITMKGSLLKITLFYLVLILKKYKKEMQKVVL